MSETNNPYQAPQTNLEVESPAGAGDWQLVEPRRVPIAHGWKWIADGFRLFAKNPGMWILAMLIFWVLMIVISILPFIGMIVSIPMAMMTGGLMRGAYESDRGIGDFKIDHLFVGFRDRVGRLAAVGGLYLLASVVVTMAAMIPLFVIFGVTMAGSANGAMPDETLAFMMVGMVLLVFVLFIPVIMAYWFAPALTMLHDDVDAIRAMKLSLVGCLRNILPLIVYAIIMTILLILFSIPLFLGLLVFWPVSMASMYAAYKDVFVEAQDEAAF